MVVKSYSDGSEMPQKSVTLASVAADEVTWGELETRWEEVRIARGNPPYIHRDEEEFKHGREDARGVTVVVVKH
jgi:hypothetical protein